MIAYVYCKFYLICYFLFVFKNIKVEKKSIKTSVSCGSLFDSPAAHVTIQRQKHVEMLGHHITTASVLPALEVKLKQKNLQHSSQSQSLISWVMVENAVDISAFQVLSLRLDHCWAHMVWFDLNTDFTQKTLVGVENFTFESKELERRELTAAKLVEYCFIDDMSFFVVAVWTKSKDSKKNSLAYWSLTKWW